MAETLYLSSGEVEVIFNENNKEQILGGIIRKNSGVIVKNFFIILSKMTQNRIVVMTTKELQMGIEQC